MANLDNVEALHLNRVPKGIKAELKRIAKRESRSLEKQIILIFKEYLGR